MTSPSDAEKGERLDRELAELIQELRLVLPGVQVLFAFLLIVPFNTGFSQIRSIERSVYFLAFVFSTVSTVLLMALASYHRLRWRQFDKERMLRLANQQALAGVAFLALTIIAVVYLITDVLFGDTVALGVASAVVILIAWLWYLLPMAGRGVDRRVSEDP
ncbi:MAG: hypothetical protein HYX52_02695 [Chloroflexi bacterium]|nr:hypothetical protein [Chloroflexota bacterium]